MHCRNLSHKYALTSLCNVLRIVVYHEHALFNSSKEIFVDK